MNDNQKLIRDCKNARRLAYCPTGSCHVWINGGHIKLWSYHTLVIDYVPGDTLVCTGTYSATTRKHISAFMREYVPGYTYHDAKRAFENNAALYINGGDLVSLETGEILYTIKAA